MSLKVQEVVIIVFAMAGRHQPELGMPPGVVGCGHTILGWQVITLYGSPGRARVTSYGWVYPTEDLANKERLRMMRLRRSRARKAKGGGR
jgi:hypothetical protein